MMWMTRSRNLPTKSASSKKAERRLQSKAATQAGGELASQAQDIKGVKVLAAKLEGADGKSLRETLDQLKNKLGSRHRARGGWRRWQG